jgi:hypothetical protein
MQYAMGECLADYGFSFLEKLHEPIALFNRVGQAVKMNEAGRKFLSVAGIKKEDFEKFVLSSKLLDAAAETFRRVHVGRNFHLVARRFHLSQYVLIELLP